MSDNEVDNNTTTSEPVSNTTTSEPVTKKDPRRVEQGKRLAAISREAKERKLRQKIEDELRQKNEVDYSKYLVPIMSSLGVFTFFYFWGKRNQQQRSPHPQSQRSPPPPPKKVDIPPPKRFESFVES